MPTKEDVILQGAKDRLADLQLRRTEIEQRLAHIAQLEAQKPQLQEILAALDRAIADLSAALSG